MAVAICTEAFDVVIPRLPVNRCLDQKGSLIKALKVILSFSNNFAQRRSGKITPFLRQLLTLFHEKESFFFFQILAEEILRLLMWRELLLTLL